MDAEDALMGTINASRKNIGSVEIIILDDYVKSKKMWDGCRWKSICRYKNCKTDLCNKTFCKDHHEHVKKLNKVLVKNNIRYKYIDDLWNQVCSNIHCENMIKNPEKSSFCKVHQKSLLPPLNVMNIVNSAKDAYKKNSDKKNLEIKTKKTNLL